MYTRYLQGQQFLRMEQMTQISLAIHRIHIRSTVGLDRREVILPLLVAHVHDAVLGKEHTIATITGRHHTVKHVNPALDEFQQIREFPEKGTEALLRSYIQFVPNAHFIFAGSRKHMMDAMFVSPKGPFYQSTQLMELSTIDSEKYAEFAAGFFLHDRRTFSNEAFHHLYERFEGITWYIQSILNRVWTHGSGLDSVQQVDDTVDELVAESESFYFDLLRSQTPAEQSILKAVGRDGVAKSISGGDFIRRNKLPAASTVRSAAAKLTERDLLYRSDAGYVVYDRFFGLWLKRL